MASNDKPAAPEPRDTLEDAQHHLYHLQHLCAFIGDSLLSSNPRTQLHQVSTESAAVTFNFIAEQLDKARDHFYQVMPSLPERRRS